VKLCLEYLHDTHIIGLEIPRWLSLGLVGVIFVVALIYAKMQGAVVADDPLAEECESILAGDEKLVAEIDGDVTK
jgi:hypothetical protein